MEDKLMMIAFEENDEYMYCEMHEYYAICEALLELGIAHTDYIIDERVWRIIWYDYIDEEWSDIWCLDENMYDERLNAVREADVEYQVKIYN